METNSYRNVRLARLRLAAAALGFDAVANNLDQIIANNVKHHEQSLEGTLMAMSAPVVDRIEQLTGEPVPESPEAHTNPRNREPSTAPTVSTETPEPTETIATETDAINPVGETIPSEDDAAA